MPLRVKLNIPDKDTAVSIIDNLVSADCGTKARDKFPQLEGLGDVIIGAGVQCLDFTILAFLDGQHDDGKTRCALAHQSANFDSSDAGHVDVEQHDIELRSANQ